MTIRPLSLTTAFLLTMAGNFALPMPADARGSSRRNYADEWRREEREEEYREEREKARQDWQEHQKEQQQRYLEHDADRQQRYLDHSERQLDRLLGNDPNASVPAAPAPKKHGTCMYGADNKVVYQPKGVVCEKR